MNVGIIQWFQFLYNFQHLMHLFQKYVGGEKLEVYTVFACYGFKLLIIKYILIFINNVLMGHLTHLCCLGLMHQMTHFTLKIK